MTRGLDHLVLCVHDLEAARQSYQSLGFTTTPIAHHDWGTANSLVQLQGCFLELLTVAEPGKISEPAPGGFGFGPFNRDFLAKREGFSMLVFDSQDARADRDEFAAKGLSDFSPFDFSRRARLPDGSEATVAFSLAFVADPRMPEAAFFTCQQHAPEYFWKPDYQRHANGAHGVAEALMVAPNPGELARFYEAMLGTAAAVAPDGSLTVATGRGRIQVDTPDGLSRRFPGAAVPKAPDSPYFAGFVVAVPSLGAVEEIAAASGHPLRTADAVRYLEPERGFGSIVAFAEA